MPCYQLNTQPQGYYKIGQGGFANEEDCLNACKEGACIESDGTCNIKPQCQCQGEGQTFEGVGTVCEPICSACCPDTPLPQEISVTLEIGPVEICYVDSFAFGGSVFHCAASGQFAFNSTLTLTLVPDSPLCAQWRHVSCDGSTRVEVIVSLLSLSDPPCSWTAQFRVSKCIGGGVFNNRNCCDQSSGYGAGLFVAGISLPGLLGECDGSATASGSAAVGFDCGPDQGVGFGGVCLAAEQCGGGVNASGCRSANANYSLSVQV